MNRKLVASLPAILLVGCAEKDQTLKMDAADIRVLCDAVANKKMANAPIYYPSGQPRPDAQVTLDWVKQGAKAECELEYRIKQQEANKPF